MEPAWTPHGAKMNHSGAQMEEPICWKLTLEMDPTILIEFGLSGQRWFHPNCLGFQFHIRLVIFSSKFHQHMFGEFFF
jgi:hypothetical protein